MSISVPVNHLYIVAGVPIGCGVAADLVAVGPRGGDGHGNSGRSLDRTRGGHRLRECGDGVASAIRVAQPIDVADGDRRPSGV